jgi:hypothetical protein
MCMYVHTHVQYAIYMGYSIEVRLPSPLCDQNLYACMYVQRTVEKCLEIEITEAVL